MERTAIQYRDFWDVPRIFLTRYAGRTFLFDCPFDEAQEDYPSTYRVYLMPALDETDVEGSWTTLSAKAVRELGEVPLDRVLFDPSRRKDIDAGILDEMLQASSLPASAQDGNGAIRP